ncbi:DUF3310 domain-containing protein [Staphylococcus saprophyticus]|uniref:DUF3310 domain-containing protein n=1 Tax=Staphylococcus saprophyticus TaxID=29385 RepID=UPI00086CE425|nr:hypothetical protein ASS84_04625 [Staphylococcus saprophyticus]
MKIRDLDLDQYVIVYDMGKSEHSEGMTVVGRVDEIVFNDDNDNVATINSLGNLYDITDDNDFELWSKSIEDKTEHIGFDKENTEKSRKLLSNDVKQRKRKDEDAALFKIKDLKVGYKIEILGDRMTGEVSKISSNGKSAEIRVDDGVYRGITDNNDFTILEWNATPQYAEDMVNHPSHYNYGDIEVINFIEQVTKHYNPNVAYHIGNAIKYLARSPHKNGKEDVAKAKWYIERAFENWDVK